MVKKLITLVYSVFEIRILYLKDNTLSNFEVIYFNFFNSNFKLIILKSLFGYEINL